MNNKFNVAVFGEALIDFLQQDNGLFKPCIGGSPFNVAVAFSRQSLNSYYVSPISNDTMGQRIAEYARAAGLITPANGISERNTSLALVTTDEFGQPDYELYRTGVADLDINAKTIIDFLPDTLEIFHTGSLALVPSMKNTLLEVFTYLKNNQVPISIDINMRKCIESERDAYCASVSELMAYANIIKVSDEDIEALTGSKNYHSFCQSLLKNNDVKIVAFTEGEKGATLLTNEHSVYQSSIKPKVLIDTVGAGDTFFAGMITYMAHHNLLKSEYIDEDTLAKINQYAAIAASINVSRQGCDPATLTEIKTYAAANGYQIYMHSTH